MVGDKRHLFLAHKAGTTRSKYKGGFKKVNGRSNNTSDYNHDYYEKNKEKWRSRKRGVVTATGTAIRRQKIVGYTRKGDGSKDNPYEYVYEDFYTLMDDASNFGVTPYDLLDGKVHDLAYLDYQHHFINDALSNGEEPGQDFKTIKQKYEIEDWYATFSLSKKAKQQQAEFILEAKGVKLPKTLQEHQAQSIKQNEIRKKRKDSKIPDELKHYGILGMKWVAVKKYNKR